jgi:hypothetical protein
MVHAALQVENEADFNAWNTSALARTRTARQAVEQWQQFVMHATDERGDPIRDFYIELFTRDERGRPQELEGLEMDVHAYSADPSFRCFHVNLSALQQQALANLWMRAIASSGSQLVGYHGFGSEKANEDLTECNPEGKWDAELNISALLAEDAEMRLFFPFTTTLIELKFNREPLPLVGKNEVCWF